MISSHRPTPFCERTHPEIAVQLGRVNLAKPGKALAEELAELIEQNDPLRGVEVLP
jgi:hypothetical protein